jgi:hypothetical protein
MLGGRTGARKLELRANGSVLISAALLLDLGGVEGPLTMGWEMAWPIWWDAGIPRTHAVTTSREKT